MRLPLSAIAPLSAQVAEADGEDVQPAKPAASEPPLDDSACRPLPHQPRRAGQIAVSYTGSLRGLLDTIASQSGLRMGLRRQNEPRHIQRNAGTDVHRTGRAGPFDTKASSNKSWNVLVVPPSAVRTSIQPFRLEIRPHKPSQINKTELKFDIWREVEGGIKASLLSKRGTVTINQAAGTVTVRDSYVRLRDISAYIDAINQRLSRQVAITVRVGSELSDTLQRGT